MKITFFGSSEFAVPSLKVLLDSSHEIVAIVTQPDREKGRRCKVQPTALKSAAPPGITVYQPESLKDAAAVKFLRSLLSDMFIVVAFGQILPKEILKIPKLYSINLHPSLLPKYRGSAPVNRAIINGETETGISIIRMNERMDAGDIILQKKVKIEKEDTSEALTRRLSELGAVLLLDALKFIEGNRIKFKKQDEKKASLAPMLKKEDGLIDWNKSADEIHNTVRGTVPWPGAYTFLDGKMLKIRETDVTPLYEKPETGKIFDVQKDYFMIACGKGALRVKELQLEGGKRIDTASFLRGHRLEKGTFLGKKDKNLAE